MLVTKITNTSESTISVQLKGGATIGLPAHSSLENADVVNTEALTGKVHYVHNLTEVNTPSGKTKLNE